MQTNIPARVNVGSARTQIWHKGHLTEQLLTGLMSFVYGLIWLIASPIPNVDFFCHSSTSITLRSM
jgi:hypothetical protein